MTKLLLPLPWDNKYFDVEVAYAKKYVNEANEPMIKVCGCKILTKIESYFSMVNKI